MGVALLAALVFFWPYLGIISIAAIMAYCFLRPYRWLTRHMADSIAAMLTLIISIIVVAVPLALILVMAVTQGVQIANDLTNLSTAEGGTLDSSTAPIVTTVNNALAGLNNGQPVISQESAVQFVKETLPALLKAFAQIVLGIAGSFPALMTSIIIYGFLFITFLIKHKSVVSAAGDLSPFDARTSDLYFNRAGSIVKASLIGQLLIAVILGVLTALLLFLIGMQPYFFFFVIILTLLSLVPLGTGVVVMPLAILAMLNGQFWQGFWVMVIYLVVICNIDNFLRPRFIPKDAKLLPAIITLSTFCGLFYFGILGIVYGPLIAIILTTTFEIYRQYRHDFLKSPAARATTTASQK